MAVLGRILQVVGWLWLLAGFFGNFINLPTGNIVPAIIVLFVSRVIRAQAQRQEQAEELATESASQGRPTATEQRAPRPPEARPRPEPTKVRPRSAPEQPRTEEVDAGSRQEALEQILLAGKGLELESHAVDDDPSDLPDRRESMDPEVRLSSAEMVARARQRWDRRP